MVGSGIGLGAMLAVLELTGVSKDPLTGGRAGSVGGYIEKFIGFSVIMAVGGILAFMGVYQLWWIWEDACGFV